LGNFVLSSEFARLSVSAYEKIRHILNMLFVMVPIIMIALRPVLNKVPVQNLTIL
jgi:hypothetical protein